MYRLATVHSIQLDKNLKSVQSRLKAGQCPIDVVYIEIATTVIIILTNLTAAIMLTLADAVFYQYGVGFDAGSSHTSMYVYKWPSQKLNGTGIVEQVMKCPSKSQRKYVCTLVAVVGLASVSDNGWPVELLALTN